MNLYQTFCQNYLVISIFFSKFVPAKQNYQLSMKTVLTKGRMELAQDYFPSIQPRSAWLKLKSLLLDDPELSAFATQKRRTFLPNEVNIIYQHLGRP